MTGMRACDEIKEKPGLGVDGLASVYGTVGMYRVGRCRWHTTTADGRMAGFVCLFGPVTGRLHLMVSLRLRLLLLLCGGVRSTPGKGAVHGQGTCKIQG